MIKTKVTVELKSPDVIFRRVIPESKQLAIAKMIETEFGPYVPRASGRLMEDTTVTPDSITYNAPYAAYQYNGDGFNFSKLKNPLATAHWDKAAMAAKGDKIVKQAEAIIRR